MLAHALWHRAQFCKKIFAGDQLARELEIKGRRYWILSEPHGTGWKATAVEVRDDGSSEPLGIEATAETRGAADDTAERKLRRLLGAY